MHNSKHSSALTDSPSLTPVQEPALPLHSRNTSERQDHVPSMYPPDLVQVMAAWENLPAAVKAGIVAMVGATKRE